MQNQQVSEQIATATKEGKMKQGKPCKRQRKEAAEDLNVMEIKTDRQLELFHQPTLMYNFLYSLTTCLLHYYPRHVSSINMPIFRRKNCIHTPSGIFAVCKRLPITLVEIPDAV